MKCTTICSYFTDDNSCCSGPEIAKETKVFTNIADYIVYLVVSAKLCAASASAFEIIKGRFFVFSTVGEDMKLPKVSANN